MADVVKEVVLERPKCKQWADFNKPIPDNYRDFTTDYANMIANAHITCATILSRYQIDDSKIANIVNALLPTTAAYAAKINGISHVDSIANTDNCQCPIR